MITSSMTWKEMYAHLAKDIRKVKYKIDYYFPKAIKDFRKTRTFPACKYYDYTVPETGNKYIIYYYLKTANDIEKPLKDFFIDIFDEGQRFIIKCGPSGYKHTPESSLKAIRLFQVYTSHFLHRYNERFLKNEKLTSTEIACHYFARNQLATPIEINEDVNRNFEKYGDGGRKAFVVHDGLCFTQVGLQGEFYGRESCVKDKVDAMTVLFKTFISEHEMSDGQQYAIYRKYFESSRQAFKDCMDVAENGIVHLRLE